MKNLTNTEITNVDETTGLPVLARTNGYRPALSAIKPLAENGALSAIPVHVHELEPWMTEDGWEILECTTCGAQW